jgi:HD-like signal output (HDOD) protein
MSSFVNLQNIITELVDIPPAPQILPRLQAVLRRSDSDMEDVVALLKADVSLSSKILRFANSSYFAGSAQANGLDEAIQRIGFREVNRLVSVAVSKSVLESALPVYNAKEGELFENALARAQLMHANARSIDPNRVDTYYTTGLLSEIGKIVINQYLKSRGLSLYGGHDGNQESMEEIDPAFERRVLGFDHARAGAVLLESWQFPPEITVPIQYQYEAGKAPDFPVVARSLDFSRQLAPAFGQWQSVPESIALPDSDAEGMGLSAGVLRDNVRIAHAEFIKIRDMIAAS